MSVAGLSRPPRMDRGVCQEPVLVSKQPYYLLRVDRRCRLILAKRSALRFTAEEDVVTCFEDCRLRLADVPRASYRLLLDARFGPSRSDDELESTIAVHRVKLLSGFDSTAAIAKNAVGKLQLQRHAKDDGRTVFATLNPGEAYRHLGVALHES